MLYIFWYFKEIRKKGIFVIKPMFEIVDWFMSCRVWGTCLLASNFPTFIVWFGWFFLPCWCHFRTKWTVAIPKQFCLSVFNQNVHLAPPPLPPSSLLHRKLSFQPTKPNQPKRLLPHDELIHQWFSASVLTIKAVLPPPPKTEKKPDKRLKAKHTTLTSNRRSASIFSKKKIKAPNKGLGAHMKAAVKQEANDR